MSTILVIDDEPGYRALMGFELVRFGHTIVPASTGMEGLALLKTQKMDLVITDMKMPGIDGLDTIRAIRKLCPDTPIILMTGHAEEDILQKAKDLRITACLLKPFDVEELKAAIRSVL